jgi:hypothetical protein
MDGMLCGCVKRNLPTREDERCRMALEGAGKNLGAFDTEIHSAILDSGNSGLRNAREFGELTLAQLLEFAQDRNGLTD